MKHIAVAAALSLAASTLPLTPAMAAADKDHTEAVEETLEGAQYVAMGSSYAAGPLLPPAKPGAPARCGQSLNNYPTLLAERFSMVLIDRSCSGATTDHVLGPWKEIPAQIASVTPETRLVTITIGGNDLSYVGNLFSATCAFNAKAVALSGAKPKSCPPVRIPTEADYARDEAQLNAIVQRIRDVAPQARVVFVQYLAPLPRAGSLCAATPVSEEHAAIVRTIGHRLAEMTDRVALANGALIVEMNLASANHTPCDPDPWMIGAPQGYDGKEGLQWHLNKAGMQAAADGIAYWLIEAGVKPGKAVQPVAPEAPSDQPASTEDEDALPASAPVIPEGDAP